MKYFIFGFCLALFILSARYEMRTNSEDNRGQFLQYEEMKKWPSVEGVIVKQNDHSFKARYGNLIKSYLIDYIYVVGGRTFHSNKISIDSTNADVMLKEGRRVTVHYDPKSPENAVLVLPLKPENNQKNFPYTTVSISFLLLIFVLGPIYVSYQKCHERNWK